MGTEKKLAELQKQYMEDDALKSGRDKVHESWFNENTIDYWRHKRMYETIKPLAGYFKDARWLTVGDGRFGLDAIRLKNIFSFEQIYPTDIAGTMLEISKQKGRIESYGVENAEQLSFDDNTYDVVFCKEAFHHFPRPYLALYEMIRVAKEAVIMIEPAENRVTTGVKTKNYLQSAVKLFFSKLAGKSYKPYLPAYNTLNHAYEEAGNYLYAVSVRELEKLVHGMDLAGLAYKGFNDWYIHGCEFENAATGNPLFEKIKTGINNADEACKTQPMYHQPNMVSVVIFKKAVDETLKQNMLADGFRFIEKLKNPYL